MLRTLEDTDEKYFEERVEELKQNGFYNFFYLQRFGTPRLLTHYYGLLLFRGEYEKLVLTMLTEGSRWELPYFREFRRGLKELGTDWKKIKEEISKFPVIMRQENILVAYLADNPDDYIGALQQIPDQVRISAYAYSSYLFNKVLSGLIREGGGVPPKLPLVLSFEDQDRAPYKELLEADNISFPFYGLKPFPFIRLQKRYVSTRFQPEIEHAVLKPKGAVLSFTLKKGAYATTFLSHIFTLVSGLPLPEGMYLEPVDAKKIIDTGTTAPTVEKLDKFIMRRGMDLDEILD